MAGYGLPKEHHLSLVLENNLKQQGFEIEIINGSVSGSTSSGGLNRAEWSLSEPGIDLMILGCLLYTSPSPRDGLLSRMPSSA